MSYLDFRKAMKELPQLPHFRSIPLKAKEDLQKAEKILGQRLSWQHRQFCKRYNYISFSGLELLGIFPEFGFVFPHANVLEYMDDERTIWNLNHAWFPLCDLDEGYMAYLDYGNLSWTKEPQVIVAAYTAYGFSSGKVIAKDLGQFLRMLTENLK